MKLQALHYPLGTLLQVHNFSSANVEKNAVGFLQYDVKMGE